jgi:[acyl-carrier-protein] S-malonyltransferase
VVAVDLICWQALMEKGLDVKAVAGHSLGEYPALAAAGALDNSQCLKLASLRGKLMNRDAEANPGAMAAIMGLSPEQVAEITETINGVVQPANYNSPAQTVITGLKEAVKQASDLAKEKGGKAIPLKVSGAWHSPLMAEAKKDMEQAIDQVSFKDPARLLVPNTTGAPTDQGAEIKAQLKEQLTSPVKWVQTINALMEQGIDTFIEAGPKNVLAGLIKKTTKEVRVLNFDTPETLNKVIEAL